MNKYDISIVVPVFNESGNIEKLLKRVDSSVKRAGFSYQLIFVDDRSVDSTVNEIKKYGKGLPITIHRKQGEQGKAFSILEGVKLAESEYIAMIDGDLQYPPEAIPAMLLQAREKGVSVANRKTAKTSALRKFGSRINSFIFGKFLLGLNCDVQSGLKVFKKEIIDYLDIKDVTKWTLDMPLLHTAIQLGYEIGSVDIDFNERVKGVSKINFARSAVEIASGAVKLRLKKKKVYKIEPENGESMMGAGLFHKKKKYITHTTLSHNESALVVLSGWQKLALVLILSVFSFGILRNAQLTLLIFIAFLSTLYFVDLIFNLYVLLKSLHFPPEIKISEAETSVLKDKDLPIYTVLCPLYKEERVLPHFIESVAKLDWPKNKLDVILLLEEDDKQTFEAAQKMNLPSYVRIAVVPHSFPKTKPKACNYGLAMAKGEYVVIYDAEDEPDPLQLKKVYLSFQKVGQKVFCLQCKLNYFNPNQNLLTRLFTAEYSLWFDVILPGLQSVETTIPLGGTSNHFRTADLKSVKGWDPFNVTEDCDLGIRLFSQGYKTAIVDSTTLEEANSNVKNWIRQRSRWIKGYFQTYLVHMRKPIDLVRKNGIHALVFQLVIGMRMTFILINPFLWLATIAYFVLYKYVGAGIEALYPSAIFYMAVTCLVFGNFMYLYNYMIGCAKKEHWTLIKFMFLVPIYWIMTSIAAYIAFYQLITRPHYWEKTKHGLNLKDVIKSPEELPMDVKKHEYAFIKKFAKNGITLSGGFLVMASLAANFFNFLYNAYLGRVTTASEFGTIGLIGSLLYISQIPTSGIGRTVTYKSAVFSGKYNTPIKSYWAKIRKNVIFIAFLVSVLWLIAIPLLMKIFQSPTPVPFLLFTPVWFIGFVGAVDGGFLSGNLFFLVLGLTAALESVSKFIIAFLIVTIKQPDYVYVAIPASMFITFAISYFAILRLKTKESTVKVENVEPNFPAKFFTTSILVKISSISFLSLDVILAKAFLKPSEAGAYALLSLTGSMIFFLGTLFSQFITPIVSREEGAGRNSSKVFNKLLFATTLSSFMAFIMIGLLGHITVPVLLGARALPILSYLIPYGLAMVFFTIVTNIVSYHQLRGHYSFPILSVLLAFVQLFATILFHANIANFAYVMFFVSALNLIVFIIFHYNYSSIAAALNNVLDFFEIFSYKETGKPDKNGLRILIFNWRDTKHIWAGGAENYIQELAKRWVRDGNKVTIFCGNDGQSTRNDVVDGVDIIRRGGFYTVYFWAFLYYITRFRNKFDLVIDSENGLPFFTPLYVNVPKFLLIHHVHQEVFREHLRFPFNRLAMFIEKHMMPLFYVNQKVITVSKSSMQDVLKLGLSSVSDIEIVTPGIDLKTFVKTKKTSFPSFIYLGRLKPYKNVDVAILAFSKIIKKYKNAKFFVVGSGESENYLKDLVSKLNLKDNVEFYGKVTDSERVKMLGKSWISIQPSSFEGWGITVIEANACGTPVIASNVKGLRDSVIDGETGLLVTAKNANLFAREMEELIKDEKYRKQLSEASYIWAQRFSWDDNAKKFVKVVTRDIEKIGIETAVLESLKI